jgi:predicted deacetylase
VLRNPRNLGKQGSVRRGLRALRRRALDVVALIDGDGQHDPRELPRLAAQLRDADVVIGARSHDEMPAQRQLSNWLVNQTFRRVVGVDLRDVQSGVRLYRKAQADVLADRLTVGGGYALEFESLVVLAGHAKEQGGELRVVAAPASCAYGIAASGIGPRQVVQLGTGTVRGAVRLRRAGGSAGRPRPPRALTVEIHDVSPAARDEVRRLRDALWDVGIDRATFLVVPSFEDEAGRSWDLRADAGLVEWLRAQQAEGSEIVQHGLTHRAPSAPPPGLRNAVLDRWFTRGCDEFAYLSRDEARRRLMAGHAVLGEAGLWAIGFIAPAWRQSPGTRRALAELGYRFTATLGHVRPLTGARRAVRTPALTFVAPNGALDLGKRAVMRGCELGARPASLLRVALHPQDLERHGLVEHMLQRIRGLLEHRRLTTYEEWMAERGEGESRAETRGRRGGKERGGSDVRGKPTAHFGAGGEDWRGDPAAQGPTG